MFKQAQTASIVVIASALLVLAGHLGAVRADKVAEAPYDPPINPANFSTEITNKYFRLKPGSKFTYLTKSLFNSERILVEVTDQTRIVMGVKTVVVRDRVWVGDVIKEDTRDLYAQDKDGNVWYFGEDVDNYAKGKLANNSGQWIAGVNGAKPGIIMLANPKVGDTYRQEYAKGVAEDMGTILSLNEKVVVPHGTYEGCLKTRDWSRIESANEHKYYCPQVGFVVLEEKPGLMTSQTKLISVEAK